jgi:hypothetical protein
LRNTGVSRFCALYGAGRSRPRSACGTPPWRAGGLRRRPARLGLGACRSTLPSFRKLRWLYAAAPGRRIIPAGQAGDIAYRPRTRAADIRRGRPVRGGSVHGSPPSPGERGSLGQASLTRARRRSGGTSRSGPMMSGSIPTRDSTARPAATHARLTGHGFSVCSSCLRPHSIEAGYVSGLGRSALRSGRTAGVRPSMSDSGDRRAAGSKARRPAAYPGNREAQTPRSPSCGGCNSAALRSDWPGKSSSSNCGSRSWKPTKPEISKAAAEDRPLPIREGDRPKRKPLPDHLPRRAIVHEPVHDGACTCPACGGDNTICAVAEPPTDRRP